MRVMMASVGQLEDSPQPYSLGPILRRLELACLLLVRSAHVNS